jgi:hypothetical protein
MFLKEVGYQSFNLYAFGLFVSARAFLPHQLWEKVKRGIGYTKSGRYKAGLKGNKFGFGFNPTGLELFFVLWALDNKDPVDCKWLLKEQLDHSYDCKEAMLSRGTEDVATQNARIYEAVRFPDSAFNLDILGV